jgi:hypothetical protein
MLKIIGVDNFNRDTVADELLVERIPDEKKAEAEGVCKWLNEFSCDDHGGTFYMVVDQERRLSRGMLDLV